MSSPAFCVPCNTFFDGDEAWKDHLATSHQYPCVRCHTSPGDPVTGYCALCWATLEERNTAPESTYPWPEAS